MLAHVAGRDDDLCFANVVVLDEYHLEQVADVLVIVDDGPDAVD